MSTATESGAHLPGESAWFAKLARSLQTISDNLGTRMKYTVCREITAKALGISGDHEASRLIERGAFPRRQHDHRVPAAERDTRRSRQVMLVQDALHLDEEKAVAAWMAWRPTGNLREEALERLPPAMSSVSLSDIVASPGSRMDPSFHLLSQHIARSRGWSWRDPKLKLEAMRLAASMEMAGIALDRPYPDQVPPSKFTSEAQARTFLIASGYDPIHEREFARKLAPYPGGSKEAFIKIYAGVSGVEITYHLGTNVIEMPEERAV